MKRSLVLLVGGFGVWATLACDSSPSQPAATAAKSPKPAASAPSPAPAPAAAAAIEPGAGRAASVAKGASSYAIYCASCHGPSGDGDGPVGLALNPKPAKHRDGAYMNTLSNEHLFKVIKEGGAAVGKSPMMAPWGASLKDEQIRDVVAFVRSLAEPPYEGPLP